MGAVADGTPGLDAEGDRAGGHAADVEAGMDMEAPRLDRLQRGLAHRHPVRVGQRLRPRVRPTGGGRERTHGVVGLRTQIVGVAADEPVFAVGLVPHRVDAQPGLGVGKLRGAELRAAGRPGSP